MSQFALRIQKKVNRGWLKEAKKLGQLWDVERNGTVVAVNKPYIMQHYDKIKDIEHDPVSYTYRARGDRRLLKIGDYLVGKDIASTEEQSALLERFLVVGMRLLRETVVVRTDIRAKFYRAPGFDTTSSGNFFGSDNCNYSIPATIESGLILSYNPSTLLWEYVAQPTANYSDVWIGLKFGGGGHWDNKPSLPDSTISTGWIVTCGLLTGIVLRESDIFQDEDGYIYRIDRPYRQKDSSHLYQMQATRMLP